MSFRSQKLRTSSNLDINQILNKLKIKYNINQKLDADLTFNSEKEEVDINRSQEFEAELRKIKFEKHLLMFLQESQNIDLSSM